MGGGGGGGVIPVNSYATVAGNQYKVIVGAGGITPDCCGRAGGNGKDSQFDLLIASTGQSKVFGYPDMCKFQLLLYNHNMNELAILFESNLCVIESVATDYGSGNKMTFFDGDEYFPTDVTLNLGLKETRLLTASDVYDSASNRTIF
jgi:hypothetical protein